MFRISYFRGDNFEIKKNLNFSGSSSVSTPFCPFIGFILMPLLLDDDSRGGVHSCEKKAILQKSIIH